MSSPILCDFALKRFPIANNEASPRPNNARPKVAVSKNLPRYQLILRLGLRCERKSNNSFLLPTDLIRIGG